MASGNGVCDLPVSTSVLLERKASLSHRWGSLHEVSAWVSCSGLSTSLCWVWSVLVHVSELGNWSSWSLRDRAEFPVFRRSHSWSPYIQSDQWFIQMHRGEAHLRTGYSDSKLFRGCKSKEALRDLQYILMHKKFSSWPFLWYSCIACELEYCRTKF